MDEQGYQAKERNKVVMAVYLLLIDVNDGILIARRCNTGYQDGNYNFPAGHVEEGESPFDALVREMKEELGQTIAEELRYAGPRLWHTQWRPKHDQTGDRLDLYYELQTVRGKRKVINREPEKCDDLKWVYTNEPLPENFVPQQRVVFEAIFCRKKVPGQTVEFGYSELNLDWIKENGLYKL
jgi:8-oxo-dGTP pyrophosphatase MutT (NUDIX family)